MKIFFARSIINGTSFGNITNISNDPGYSSGLKIEAFGNYVYLAWVDYTSRNPDILLKRSSDKEIIL
jgi:hypothetical protein